VLRTAYWIILGQTGGLVIIKYVNGLHYATCRLCCWILSSRWNKNNHTKEWQFAYTVMHIERNQKKFYKFESLVSWSLFYGLNTSNCMLWSIYHNKTKINQKIFSRLITTNSLRLRLIDRLIDWLIGVRTNWSKNCILLIHWSLSKSETISEIAYKYN